MAALEFGGKHNKALVLAQELALFSHIPSKSHFNRRLHALYLLAQVWQRLHQAQAYTLDTFRISTCENIRAPRSSRLWPGLPGLHS